MTSSGAEPARIPPVKRLDPRPEQSSEDFLYEQWGQVVRAVLQRRAAREQEQEQKAA
jgi:hypothetical protein